MKTIGGLEVQKELFLPEVGSLATMDPIQRGSVTIPLPQKQIEAETRCRRPAILCQIVWGSLGLSMPIGTPLHFGAKLICLIR